MEQALSLQYNKLNIWVSAGEKALNCTFDPIATGATWFKYHVI